MGIDNRPWDVSLSAYAIAKPDEGGSPVAALSRIMQLSPWRAMLIASRESGSSRIGHLFLSSPCYRAKCLLLRACACCTTYYASNTEHPTPSLSLSLSLSLSRHTKRENDMHVRLYKYISRPSGRFIPVTAVRIRSVHRLDYRPATRVTFSAT